MVRVVERKVVMIDAQKFLRTFLIAFPLCMLGSLAHFVYTHSSSTERVNVKKIVRTEIDARYVRDACDRDCTSGKYDEIIQGVEKCLNRCTEQWQWMVGDEDR